jgi:DNA-binding transcriptional ArsR family regulator
MLEQSRQFDNIFHALADPTRRALLDQLTRGPATVSTLAAPFKSTLASIVQHVQVLEASGLITTRKVGRQRTCSISTETVLRAERWLTERRQFWEARFDQLGALLESKPARSPRKRAKS